jgi:hypothetical protein
MIELITNGALPKPGKCICCGYSGNDRNYFRFQAFIPRLGQILLCTAKSGDTTGCMDEASRRFPVGFVSRAEMDEIIAENERLMRENDRMGAATDRFTAGFAGLVSAFLDELKKSDEAVSFDHFAANSPVG